MRQSWSRRCWRRATRSGSRAPRGAASALEARSTRAGEGSDHRGGASPPGGTPAASRDGSPTGTRARRLSTTEKALLDASNAIEESKRDKIADKAAEREKAVIAERMSTLKQQTATGVDREAVPGSPFSLHCLAGRAHAAGSYVDLTWSDGLEAKLEAAYALMAGSLGGAAGRLVKNHVPLHPWLEIVSYLFYAPKHTTLHMYTNTRKLPDPRPDGTPPRVLGCRHGLSVSR